VYLYGFLRALNKRCCWTLDDVFLDEVAVLDEVTEGEPDPSTRISVPNRPGLVF
jgi:hypothetical protein